MTRTELHQAILRTKDQIDQIKLEIKHASDPKEQHRLSRQKRELQFLQIWQISKFKRTDK